MERTSLVSAAAVVVERERERDECAVKDSMRSQKDIVPPYFFVFQFYYSFLSVIVNAVGNNLRTLKIKLKIS